VASDPHPSNEGAWNELERGFFATAPPDVAEPAPEPMRFDDLEPIAPPPREWRARMARAWAATGGARGVLRSVTPVLTTAARVTVRGARAQATRLPVTLRNISRDRRLVAVAAAALLVVTGISAGVVASRGGARPPAGSVRAEVAEAVGASGPMVREAPHAAVAPVAAFEEGASLPPGSAVPELPELPELAEPMPPAHHRHSKHAKGSVRHGAHAKAAGKHPARSGARAASAR
jgi:hypothetical protein